MYRIALSIVEAVLLGTLQGILEWLPVSSSGQLTVFYTEVFGLDPVYAYKLSLAAHLGTALSAIIYYRGTLIAAIRGESVWLKALVIPTIPALPVGYLLYKYITGIDPLILETAIGLSLIATGALLKLQGSGQVRSIKGIGGKDLAIVGVIEGFSVIPGISRSAVTISTLAIMGYKAADSVKASFLMAIPVTLAASLYEIAGLIGSGSHIDSTSSIIILLSSFMAGLASIKFMMAIAERLSSKIPAFLIILGLIIMLLYAPLLVNLF